MIRNRIPSSASVPLAAVRDARIRRLPVRLQEKIRKADERAALDDILRRNAEEHSAEVEAERASWRRGQFVRDAAANQNRLLSNLNPAVVAANMAPFVAPELFATHLAKLRQVGGLARELRVPAGNAGWANLARATATAERASAVADGVRSVNVALPVFRHLRTIQDENASQDDRVASMLALGLIRTGYNDWYNKAVADVAKYGPYRMPPVSKFLSKYDGARDAPLLMRNSDGRLAMSPGLKMFLESTDESIRLERAKFKRDLTVSTPQPVIDSFEARMDKFLRPKRYVEDVLGGGRRIVTERELEDINDQMIRQLGGTRLGGALNAVAANLVESKAQEAIRGVVGHSSYLTLRGVPDFDNSGNIIMDQLPAGMVPYIYSHLFSNGPDKPINIGGLDFIVTQANSTAAPKYGQSFGGWIGKGEAERAARFGLRANKLSFGDLVLSSVGRVGGKDGPYINIQLPSHGVSGTKESYAGGNYKDYTLKIPGDRGYTVPGLRGVQGSQGPAAVYPGPTIYPGSSMSIGLQTVSPLGKRVYVDDSGFDRIVK